MKFADIKNDIAFRRIFGSEDRKESLISFLNATLQFEGLQRIKEVVIMNPYQLPKLKSDKATIVDVKATDQAGRSYIVEMQVADKDGFDKRVLYYFAKAYSSQIKRGDQYRKLNPVYFIGILDFEYTQSKNYISCSQILDVETGEQTFKDVEFTIIELPKFKKKQSKLQNLFEKWVYFIKNAESLTFVPDDVDDEGLKSAYEGANQHTWTQVELDAYDAVHIREEDLRAALDKAVGKALAEGLEKGLAEGELKSKIEVAEKAILKGFDNESIVELTGLLPKQIEELRKKIKQ
jgi:predicted transposase/invertase (TIGR01784 family)